MYVGITVHKLNPASRWATRLATAAMLATASLATAAGIDNTLFLHHFDVQNTDPIFAGKPGNADYANGSGQIYTEIPPFSNAPGGQIASSPVKFGAGSLLRNAPGVGGRVMFDTENNFNVQRGTIDMWVNSSQLSSSTSFWGLWGTQVGGTFPGDLRMYIYNTGAGRTLGAYMIGDDDVANRWEVEQSIPLPLLTNNAWHHVAWEWDISLGVSATYWDGQLLRSAASFGNVHYAGNLPDQFVTRFHVGENQSGSAPFPGYIDEFRISDARRYNASSFTPPTAPYSVVVTPSWAFDVSGNWTDATNWTAAVPNAVDATAVFGGVISQARTVNVNTPITVGTITFNNSNPYSITGGGTLSMQTSTGNAAITLAQGAHQISAPLRLASNTVLGGTGTLKVASLSIDSGRALDTTTRSLVVDYAGASPRPALEALIASGFNGGTNNGPGIRTSSATATLRLGIAEAAETPFGAAFNGQSLDATSLVIRYTIAGDADLSGIVNLDDFTRLATSFGGAGRWAVGDFNYNGSVNLDDFTILAANFGSSAPVDLPRGGIPEPTTFAMSAVGALGLLRRRR